MRVTQDRAAGFLSASALVGAGDGAAVYRAGRATLCGGPDDLARYDLVFEAWFGAPELPRRIPREEPRQLASPLPLGDGGELGGEHQPDVVHATASEAEVLQHRDVASLSADEKALLDAMIGSLRPRPPVRRASRRSAWRRGEIDVHRTLRTTLRQMGEPGRIDHRRRGTRARRVVLLVDVSGSMRPYADALLRLAHAMVVGPSTGSGDRVGSGNRVGSGPSTGSGDRVGSGTGVEVFTVGTRLTRVTEALRTADPDRALVRAGEQVPDWSGGTRLGETVKAFLDRWGARGMARGAVVVVFSDGWERGDGAELGEQLARLRRLAHRVVWVNPHRGKLGYEPVQAGIVAALPHLDEFLAGHSLRTFEELLEVVARA
jgi:uncharacterized protein with von Willebrand factor type A (vWA) domain